MSLPSQDSNFQVHIFIVCSVGHRTKALSVLVELTATAPSLSVTQNWQLEMYEFTMFTGIPLDTCRVLICLYLEVLVC